jgi:hypothetical protein
MDRRLACGGGDTPPTNCTTRDKWEFRASRFAWKPATRLRS